MTTESDFAHLDTRHRGRITFDPTINAGHLLTFFGFMVSGFVAYSTLDKRVAVVEQRTTSTEQRAAEQDARIKESLGEIKQDLREVKGAVNALADRPFKN